VRWVRTTSVAPNVRDWATIPRFSGVVSGMWVTIGCVCWRRGGYWVAHQTQDWCGGSWI
jgi:hypothetical protein